MIATCRGCRRELQGAPYSTGKPAYHPESGKRVLAHYFGGWVCSPGCDQRVFREMKAQNVWGSTEAGLMANAYERHADAR